METTILAPSFNETYRDSVVVLRSGEEFPLVEVFDRNPDTFDICGIRCAQHPEIVSFAKGWSAWDGAQHLLTRMSLGCSDTYLCHRPIVGLTTTHA